MLNPPADRRIRARPASVTAASSMVKLVNDGSSHFTSTAGVSSLLVPAETKAFQLLEGSVVAIPDCRLPRRLADRAGEVREPPQLFQAAIGNADLEQAQFRQLGQLSETGQPPVGHLRAPPDAQAPRPLRRASCLSPASSIWASSSERRQGRPARRPAECRRWSLRRRTASVA